MNPLRLKGTCAVCGRKRDDLQVMPAVSTPTKIMAHCNRCKKTTDFWITEVVPVDTSVSEDSPFELEQGFGSKSKKGGVTA